MKRKGWRRDQKLLWFRGMVDPPVYGSTDRLLRLGAGRAAGWLAAAGLGGGVVTFPARDPGTGPVGSHHPSTGAVPCFRLRAVLWSPVVGRCCRWGGGLRIRAREVGAREDVGDIGTFCRVVVIAGAPFC
jgi:hypothetical protein